ncbi:MAG: phage virion morphogenesis protein [Campylobacterales bacterium]|nr:phage virion morphogenesis protein [Campylobacterales bacterium]
MSIEIQGLQNIQSSLNKLSQTLSPAQMKTTMNTIGNMVQNVIEESFEKEQSPWGEKWEKLKDATLKHKLKKGKSSKKLRFEGDLSDRWLTHADATSVTIASNTKSPKGYPYGAVHQWGSKKVPARRFFPVDESGKMESGLQKQIEDYLDKKIEDAMG